MRVFFSEANKIWIIALICVFITLQSAIHGRSSRQTSFVPGVAVEGDRFPLNRNPSNRCDERMMESSAMLDQLRGVNPNNASRIAREFAVKLEAENRDDLPTRVAGLIGRSLAADERAKVDMLKRAAPNGDRPGSAGKTGL